MTDDCILWPGRIDPDGYGRLGGSLAHRRVYERNVGPIPADLQVDHICFTPACINPAHLRLLTLMENSSLTRSSLRTHCVNGHEFTPENTYIRPRRPREGHRDCRACIRARVRQYKARLRAAA